MQLNSKAYLSALVSKIKTWSLANWPILLILLFAFVIRLYFINVNHAVWWDEAQHLLMAKHYAFGTPTDGWYAGRSPIFALILAPLFYIFGNTELPVRLLIVFMSTAMVYLTYSIGKRLYGRAVGVFAAAVFAVFWEVLFTTFRVLLEIPASFFLLLSLYFFVIYFENRKNAQLILCGICFAIATLMRYDNAFMFFAFAVILLLTKRFKALLTFTTAAAVVAIPQLIRDYLVYHSPFYSMQAFLAPMNIAIISRHYSLLTYLQGFYNIFGPVLLPLFVLGLVYAVLKIKKVNSLVLLLPTVIFLSVFSMAIVEEPRFFVRIFPMIFILMGVASYTSLNFILRKVKIDNKKIVYTAMAIVIAVAMVHQLYVGLPNIQSKAESYVEVKEGALWVKDHTLPSEYVASNAPPFVSYYAERPNIGILFDDEKTLRKQLEEYNVSYVIVSGYELRDTDPAYVKDMPSFSYLSVADVVNNRVFVFEVDKTKLKMNNT